jgi:beta-lactamase class A
VYAHRILPLLSIALIILVIGCASREPEHTPSAPDSTAAARSEPFGATDTSLAAAFRAVEAKSGGKLGVAAIDLESGWRASYRGEETFPMASIAKLPMVVAFLRRVDAGEFRLDSTVTITPADHRPGGSILFHRAMHAGGIATLHDLLEATLIYSDNTACDYLLRLIGGPSHADSLMATLGLDRIDISHSEGDLILRWAGVDPARGDSAWSRDRAYAMIEAAGDTAWRAAEARLVDDPSDAAPPAQMAQLLAKLQRRSVLSRSSSDTLLAIMTRAATGKGRIAALLPPGTPLAHKTGTISSTTNDAGIITLPGGRGHVAIAVFVKGSRVGVRGRERAIAEAAKLVYDRITGMAGE